MCLSAQQYLPEKINLDSKVFKASLRDPASHTALALGRGVPAHGRGFWWSAEARCQPALVNEWQRKNDEENHVVLKTTHLVWKPLRLKLFAKGKHQISQHLITWAIPESQESCCPITKPEEAEDRLGDSSHVQEYNTSCCCTEHFAVTNSHIRAQTGKVIPLQTGELSTKATSASQYLLDLGVLHWRQGTDQGECRGGRRQWGCAVLGVAAELWAGAEFCFLEVRVGVH